MPFTNAEKYAAVVRETETRRAIYPAQVFAGRITQEEADRAIGVMEEIGRDYLKLADRPGIENSGS